MGCGTSVVIDESFLTLDSHKIYIIVPPNAEFIKVGYTKTPIKKLFGVYRRPYGALLVIYKVYPCQYYKEDDEIHDELQPKFGLANNGREIYHRKYLKEIVRYLDKKYDNNGVGPYSKQDLVRFVDHMPPIPLEDYTLEKMEKLTVGNTKKKDKGKGKEKVLRTKCRRCKKVLDRDDQLSVSDYGAIHKDCFQCTKCQKKLTQHNYVVFNKELYCKQHLNIT